VEQAAVSFRLLPETLPLHGGAYSLKSMARRRTARIRALVVRTTPLLEYIRTHGLRESLIAARGVVLRQVAGRFPRLGALVNALRTGQRQSMPLSSSIRWTDVEVVPVDPGPSTEALLAALRDPSAEVAIAAIGALRAHAGAPVTNALTEVLRNADGYFNPMTQVAAIQALRDRKDDIAPAVWARAVSAIDAELSVAAIRAVATQKPEHALSLVRPVLEDTSGYYLPMVREAAEEALRSAGLL